MFSGGKRFFYKYFSPPCAEINLYLSELSGGMLLINTTMTVLLTKLDFKSDISQMIL